MSATQSESISTDSIGALLTGDESLIAIRWIVSSLMETKALQPVDWLRKKIRIGMFWRLTTNRRANSQCRDTIVSVIVSSSSI